MRKQITDLVYKRITDAYEGSEEAKKRWQKNTFGHLPELELGDFIDMVYRELSDEYQKMSRERQEREVGPRNRR